ncbi:MAG: DNA polymerase IV [Bifidobacteriaceae bacterium]|jgi:DNA polymerase-4|nr:DNA polymerase IV [Bifidobacteriaceae bacterium]
MSTGPRLESVKKNWGADIKSLKIVHIDMDSFFATIEQARHPETNGKCVIAGGTNQGGTLKGVVSSANYLAREFGIKAGMPMAEAKRRCPHAICFPVDMEHYQKISEKAFDIFYNFTPFIEPYSIDEVFLDLSGCQMLFGTIWEAVEKIRNQIYKELGVTCSAGIAENKLVAKLASTQAKPNGQMMVCADAAEEFVQSLPLKAIWGIGPATRKKLENYGIETVKQLADLSLEKLQKIFKTKMGEKIFQAAHGLDSSKLAISEPSKSIGNEETFYTETYNKDEVLSHLLKMTEKTVKRLGEEGFKTRRITVNIKYSDFSRDAASITLKKQVSDSQSIYKVAKSLFEKLYNGKKVRLIGVSLSKLENVKQAGEQKQFSIFEYGYERNERLQNAINLLNKKYNKHLVHYM